MSEGVGVRELKGGRRVGEGSYAVRGRVMKNVR